ncbi:peptidoglycan bridge formation glycyltransferase FemA/FemB family protein [Candidatus Giovannonibacteria bacterium]|nr:peptidoglycan bridge formation glycyltransferase FemA/FemB family protein [Candidatus Giovannonibacteria bacterium]
MSNYLFRELNENEDFDPAILDPSVYFTQAKFYGDWQKDFGREAKRYVIYEGGTHVGYFQLVKYPLLLGKSYLYSPYGPVLANFSKGLLAELKSKIMKIAKKENAVFVRLDFSPPPDDKTLVESFFKKAKKVTYHAAHFQPRTDWVLPLDKNEEALLAGMHKATRYSIRFADKNGIASEIITHDFEKYFDTFYNLMVETSIRDGFSLHPKKYYESIFKNISKIPNSYLAAAKYQEEVLVINLIIVYNKSANYIFSGSANKYRNLSPSYSALWAAIRHAKKIGCENFNLGGISLGETYKGWENLSKFKQRFGGRQINHSDFYDVVNMPFWYQLYNLRRVMKV